MKLLFRRPPAEGFHVPDAKRRVPNAAETANPVGWLVVTASRRSFLPAELATSAQIPAPAFRSGL
jgi:hypothetical protein